MTIIRIYRRKDTNLPLFGFCRSPLTESTPITATLAEGHALGNDNPNGIMGVSPVGNKPIILENGTNSWFCQDIAAMIRSGVINIEEA